MAKRSAPTILLSEIVKELEIINYNVYQIKTGAHHLIDMIEKGADNGKLKEVIKIFNMKEHLDNLAFKD